MTKKLCILFAAIGMIVPQMASAYDFAVGGIYYNKSGKNATVTYKTTDYNSYSGFVMIPATVVYHGVTYNVTCIGDHAFSRCSNLSFVAIPNSVTRMEKDAFAQCSGLTSITIPNSVTNIGDYAFSGCSGLTSVTIPSSVTSIGSFAFSDCSGLTSITIPNSVTCIGNYAFYGCSGLTSITIPSSVTSIGEYAFHHCCGLTSVTIGFGVTSIGNEAFYGCTALTSVTIPNSVRSIGRHAFSACSGLTSITIPNSVTSIGDGAFRSCSGLASINVQTGNTKYNSRESCNAIIETASSTLVAGCKNTIIPNSVTSIGEVAFAGCSGLTSITIPSGVTSIGNYAFSGCSGLTSVTIGSGVTSIGSSAFVSCSGLTSITIPNSVTSIEDRAFFNCSGLTSVTIPNSVTSIGNSAFSGCRLTSVTNKALVPQKIDSSTFSTYGTLHVLEGNKDAYAAMDYWNKFKIVDDLPFTKLTSITLDKRVYTCAVGEIETASVGSYLPEDATINSVTWSAAAPGIIFIDATTGQFVGLADGETTITATAVDGSGVTASAIVKVGSAAEGIVSEILDETSSTRLINLNGQYTTDAQHGVILQTKGHGKAKKVLRK